MIWSLDIAHPAHRLAIRDIITSLMERWPQAPLKEVRIYEPQEGDVSMGNADEPGVIALNAHWFAQPPKVLEEHAQRPRMMPLGGGRMIAWHGNMSEEPWHLCAHEFGHVLALTNKALRLWGQERWEYVTRYPEEALTGYEIADADECMAEGFALYSLGFAPPDLANAMATALR